VHRERLIGHSLLEKRERERGREGNKTCDLAVFGKRAIRLKERERMNSFLLKAITDSSSLVCQSLSSSSSSSPSSSSRRDANAINSTRTKRGEILRMSAKRGSKNKNGGGGGGGGGGIGLSEDTAELFEVTRTNPNMRTLEECANLLRRGGVGIIPTDTKYSFVADLNNKDAIQNLYTIKGIDSNKPLSILCRGFRDIDTYTLGFPPATRPGMTDPFKLARKCLPGPYTFILPASKSLPKICLLDTSSAGHTRLSKCQQRKTIGCRLPDCEVTLALLDLLDAPLMCSTVPFDGDVQPIVMRDEYSRCAFVLDAGMDTEQLASTVIDLSTGDSPKVLRVGAGDASVWSEDGDVHVEVDDPDLAWGFA